MSDSSHQSSFLRVLGRRDVVALAFGAMIGWSWVVLTGTWITSAGVLGAITAFLLGGPLARSAYFSIVRLGPQRCVVGSLIILIVMFGVSP